MVIAFVVACLLGPAVAVATNRGTLVHNPKSGLRTWEFGAGRRAFILLHGYGSSAEQWVPFTETIRLARGTRFVFPEAPEPTIPPDGPIGGHAWWRLDLASFLMRGETMSDLSGARPVGLGVSANMVRKLVGDLQGRGAATMGQTILGGFSQGAMVAADVAFSSDEPLKALVLLSGTFVDEAGWTKGMSRRRNLPIFMSHGRRDDVLNYDIALRLRDVMKRAGLRVTWVPFDGGHETPAEVVTALNRFLENVESTAR